MNSTIKNIEPEITNAMSKIYSLLCKMNDENFDNIALEINSNICFLTSIKNKYMEEYNNGTMPKNAEQIHLAKQIQKKFDNIITEKSGEIKIIGEELKSIRNKKQLIGYRV
ncbi:MAG TPA: hypothetical protein PK397_02805 [Ignavibacteriaceae bacterium]|jgi:hypothetical protein|nr:hypothetical protein [Ignavibacteriaceae bacterium]